MNPITPFAIDHLFTGSFAQNIPYSFAWSGPGFFNSNNQDIENISTGDYTITVTDGNNCSYQESFNVTTPNPIVINEVINNISCFQEDDGSIDLTISGGTSPYNYSWSTLDNLQDINNLSPGVYEITVTDDEGCFESALYEIEEPELLTATVSTIDVDCFGDNTGTAISDINGGTPPYIQTFFNGISSATTFVCIANSRVGATTKILGLFKSLIFLSFKIFHTAGNKKPSVFPEPVSAIPTISRPADNIGQHCACIGVGAVNPLHTVNMFAPNAFSAFINDCHG